MMDEIKRYTTERDAVLRTGDLKRFTRWASKRAMKFSSPEVAEITMHKSITAARSLPKAQRAKSKQWLLSRGYKSLDDGDI